RVVAVPGSGTPAEGTAGPRSASVTSDTSKTPSGTRAASGSRSTGSAVKETTLAPTRPSASHTGAEASIPGVPSRVGTAHSVMPETGVLTGTARMSEPRASAATLSRRWAEVPAYSPATVVAPTASTVRTTGTAYTTRRRETWAEVRWVRRPRERRLTVSARRDTGPRTIVDSSAAAASRRSGAAPATRSVRSDPSGLVTSGEP